MIGVLMLLICYEQGHKLNKQSSEFVSADRFEIAAADKYVEFRQAGPSPIGIVKVIVRLRAVDSGDKLTVGKKTKKTRSKLNGRSAYGQSPPWLKPQRCIDVLRIFLDGKELFVPRMLYADIANVRLMPCLGMNPPRGNAFLLPRSMEVSGTKAVTALMLRPLPGIPSAVQGNEDIVVWLIDKTKIERLVLKESSKRTTILSRIAVDRRNK